MTPPNTPALDAFFAKHGGPETRYFTLPSGVVIDQAVTLLASMAQTLKSPAIDPSIAASLSADVASVPQSEIDAAKEYEDFLNHAGAYANPATPPIAAPESPVAPVSPSVPAPVAAPISITQTGASGVTLTATVPASHPQHSTLYNVFASIFGFLKTDGVPIAEALVVANNPKLAPIAAAASAITGGTT